MSESQAVDLMQRGWTALVEAGRKQAAYQASQEPAQRFIELLGSAIGSGCAHLANKNGGWPDHKPEAWGWRELSGASHGEWLSQGARVGWIDEDDIFLDLDAAYKASQCMTAGTGDGLTVGVTTLRKRLAEKGMLIRTSARESLSVRRVLEGRLRKVVHLAIGILCVEPDIPDISVNDMVFAVENGDFDPDQMSGCDNDLTNDLTSESPDLASMSGSMSGAQKTCHENHITDPPEDPKNEGDVRNVRYVRSDTGEGPTEVFEI